MISADLAYPFTLGLVAAFNPCGFAMLPVYVSFFLGKDTDASTARNIMRALKVGLSLTGGFVAVFGAFGILTASILSQGSILDYTPYVTFGLGFLLIPFGIAMLRGFELKISTPRLDKGGDSGEMWSMFLFGVSYAVVSLGCTVGIFVATLSTAFTSDGFFDGVSVFLAYGLGMGAVIMTLTVGLAMAKTSIATNMRKILPWVNRISGVMLALSGAYLIVYGWWEIQVLRGNIQQNSLVSFFENIQTQVSIWIDQTGPTRLGAGLLLLVGAALLRALWSETFSVSKAESALADAQAYYATALEEHDDDSDEVRAALAGVTAAERALAVKPALRWGALGALAATWAVLEFVRSWNGERANLFVLPVIRTIVGFPARIGNWFSDPLRWAVLGELVVLGVIGLAIYFRFFRTASGEITDGTSTDQLVNA